MSAADAAAERDPDNFMFSYNNADLAALGDLSLKQHRELDPAGDAPQRAKVTLTATLDLFERTFSENYALVQSARAALSKPNGLLLWRNADTLEDYINQTATFTGDDLPDEWGQYHQALVFTFSYYEALDTSAQNLPLTYTPDGGTPLTFSNVTKWAEEASVSRFDPKRPHRRETQGKLLVGGLILGDVTLPLDQRRALLAASVAQYRIAMNTAQGRLVFGQDVPDTAPDDPSNPAMFSHTVRVSDFKADINQAIAAIEFSFSAEYTLFPDEAGYATVEATGEEKDAMTGEVYLTVAGKIQASDETTARTKLAAVTAVFLAQYGYSGGQQLDLTTTPNLISANADGDTFTELSFSGQWRRWKTTNQMATFTKTGSAKPVPFGNVRLWDRSYRAERFDQHRSQRRHATGMVSGSGTWVPPVVGRITSSLPVRRALLLGMERRMMAEVNGADGTLAYGDESLVVRMEEFSAKVNQAETGVDWSFTASYSMFPNEGGYATCEFTADLRDDIESGDEILVFAGAIEAPTGALARAKLATLRGSTLGIYGFADIQKLRGTSACAAIDANGDATAGVAEGLEDAGDIGGTSFLRLTWNEEYRRRIPGSIVSSQFQVATRDDTTTGLVMTTFSGTVTATGATADAALAAAMARALALGTNKQATLGPAAFLKASTLTVDQRQLTADNPVEFLRLQFSYEYQGKLGAGRAYLEMNTAVNQQAFEADSESVGGFVTAADFATATRIYQQQVRAAYAGRLIRNETLTQSQVRAETPVLTAPQVQGVTLIIRPPPAATTPVMVSQPLRLEFQFTAHRDKPAGRVTARYGISVSRDFRTLTKKSVLRGSVFALNRTTADGFLNTLLGGFALGSNMASDRNEDREYAPAANLAVGIDVLMKLDFEEVFESPLTGVVGVIEMRLSESVTYSNTRWAVQPIPFDANGGGGISIVQPAGMEEGNRAVHGSVTAATLSTAEAWAWRQQSLLTGDADKGHYPTRPQLDRDYEFQPRVDGIAQGGSANVQLYRVTFSFGEILPNYPAPK